MMKAIILLILSAISLGDLTECVNEDGGACTGPKFDVGNYMGYPRFVFSGRFNSDPSTVNNDPTHFDDKKFRRSFDALQTKMEFNGWWNPSGSSTWRFVGCKVQSVTYQDRTTTTDPLVEPLIGAQIVNAPDAVSGKLVDLDPEQQMVSEIWGLKINLIPSFLQPKFSLNSTFRVSAFADIGPRFSEGRGDSGYGAFYQSVLDNLSWGGDEYSRLLRELKQVSNGELSIKFLVFGYNQTYGTPDFTFGKIIGIIGPHAPREPDHFVSRRFLDTSTPGWLPAYAQIQHSELTVDLGNTLHLDRSYNIKNEGPLYVAITNRTSGSFIFIGEVPYLQITDWATTTGGLVSFQLSASLLELVQTSSLLLIKPDSNSPSGYDILLSEAADGIFVRADQFVYRLNPKEKKFVNFYATKFGKPLTNAEISLGFDSTLFQPTNASPDQQLGVPETELIFKRHATTNASGVARVAFIGGNPNHIRPFIEGQLYGVTYQVGSNPPQPGQRSQQNQLVNFLVFNEYTIPENPDWVRHVEPILRQYAQLYPIMRPMVDLSSYQSLMKHSAMVLHAISLPISSPNYMPVTRDLSLNKIKTLQKWFKNSTFFHIDCLDDLKEALQFALRLELSTIPPYLTAYYSIKPGMNTKIATLLKGIYHQEMGHMWMVSNMLISIGSFPDYRTPAVITAYPGLMPSGVSPTLVRLRKLSLQHVYDVFMGIERPSMIAQEYEDYINFNASVLQQVDTIGWFYDQVARSFQTLSDSKKITFGNLEKQVQHFANVPIPNITCTSLADALRNIKQIKAEGEGTGPFQLEDGNSPHELSHYWKFASIYHGRYAITLEKHIDKIRKQYGKTRSYEGIAEGTLNQALEAAIQEHIKEFIKDSAHHVPRAYPIDPEHPFALWAFKGDEIPFDPTGVWNMMDDPMIEKYPINSRARVLSQQFAETWQALLESLHQTFNGQPDNLAHSISLMYSLDTTASYLLQTDAEQGDNTTAGPTFEYPYNVVELGLVH